MAILHRRVDELQPFGQGGVLNVVVETPAGSRCKFKFEPGAGVLTVSKFLPEGFAFPFDFGFVPGTGAEDGDPLDVMLISETGTDVGCLVPARLIGQIQAEQQSKGSKPVRNDRMLAVPVASRQYARVTSVKELPKSLVKQIEFFLASYGRLDGKEVRITRLRGPKRATRTVRQARATIERNRQA